MVEQQENETATEIAATVVERRTRVQSDIEFPYADLQVVSELAKTLHQRAGNACDDDELAAWLNQAADGGTYRARRSAARMFGLIEIHQGRITLTSIGIDLCDPQKEHSALADAFLAPELYGVMYEKYRGQILPPAAAIERQMEQLGVSPKQKIRARQAFHKSAIYAGFIDATNGRFVKPGNAASDRRSPSNEPEKKHTRVGGGDGGGGLLDLDPLLVELLRKIPAKHEGWPAGSRVRWFRTFAMNVSQIFDGDDAPVDLDITLSNLGASR